MERSSGRSSVVSGPAILAAVLDAAVDASARPDGAAVPAAAAYGVYPLIILIVYVIVTGGILCSRLSGRSLLLINLCMIFYSSCVSAFPRYSIQKGLE